MPYGAANFLKELARGAIDSGADMFVTTGNHNLGPIEIYDSPGRGKRPIFYGLGNFFWSDVQELLPADLFARNRELLKKTWQDPERATEYDLTAPLNRAYFAHEFTFQSVIAEVRFKGNELVGGRAASGRTRLRRPTDHERHSEAGRGRSRSAEILDQVVKQTAQFGLPALGLRFDGARAVIATGR